MFVAPPMSAQASPAALELAMKITTVIREFQRGRSDVTQRDVRQALRMAEVTTGASASRPVLVVAIALAVGLGLLVAMFLGANRSPGSPAPSAMPTALLALLIFMLLILVLVVRAVRR